MTTVRTTTGTSIPFSLSRNARHDVTTTGPCTEVAGSWILHGNVTNSAKTTRNYQIVVDIVSQPGDTVLDTRIVVTPRVAPGDKVPWSATSAPGLTDVACVIRQVQSPA